MNWARHKDHWPLAEHSRFVRCRPHTWHVQEAGTGPTVLLLHGAGGATQSWRQLFPLLTAEAHVIAIDLPGQGFTRMGSRIRCGIRQMAADILALCADQGWDPALLIGHSAGAALALRIAEDMRAPPPRVVGINAALAPFGGVAGILFPVMAKALSIVPLVPDLFSAIQSRGPNLARLMSTTGSKLSAEELEYYCALIGDRDHVDATLQMMSQWQLDPLLARLSRHPSDVLLIAGENDRTVPPSTSLQAAARLRHGKSLLLPGLGHLAHEEDAPAVHAAMRAGGML